MGFLEKLSRRVPRGLAVTMLGMAGFFGMRTPPEPEVIAQSIPAKGTEGEPPEWMRAGRGESAGEDERE